MRNMGQAPEVYQNLPWASRRHHSVPDQHVESVDAASTDTMTVWYVRATELSQRTVGLSEGIRRRPEESSGRDPAETGIGSRDAGRSAMAQPNILVNPGSAAVIH